MIAQLSMYDRGETAPANDRFWALIREQLGHGPETLTRGGDLMQNWLSPDLVLAQTCGYPYRARLHGNVTLVGTPDYGLPDCAPGHYYSVFVARRDDARVSLPDFGGARFAYNEALSQSGWAAPRYHADRIGLNFGSLVQTGGHALSAQAVAAGDADFAALDAVTWAMVQKWDACAQALKVIDRTEPTPGLPLISAVGAARGALFNATSAAIDALCDEDRQTLMLRRLVDIPAAAYLAIPNPPAP